jgi:hypothetical protein
MSKIAQLTELLALLNDNPANTPGSQQSEGIFSSFIGKFCMVRTYSAGVFAGYLESVDEHGNGVVRDAIRIWKWDGACSLSQLAMEGTKKPSDCMFAVPVESVGLVQIVEIIPITPVAEESINGVPSWKK